MMDLMRPWNTLWFAAVVTALGLWADGARAQADDGGWFDSSSPARSERPVLKIHGEGPYDPPPADFQSESEQSESEAAPVESGAVDEEAAELLDEETEAKGQRQAVREFSPHLAPYGRWVDDPYYGRIWVPARSVVGRDFAPYVSAGHWELTVDDEWLWVSDYPFGWVTFHYGRWVWASGSGWGWVPGYRYAPAWVDFRIGTSGYVGWGPAAPYRVWRNGVFMSLGWRSPHAYVFCPTTYVFAPTLHRHVIRDRYRVRSIAAQTYRYRPQRVAGVYTRSPRLVEAGISRRSAPTRRVVARPRVGDSQGNLLRSRREVGASTRSSLGDRGALRRDAFPAAQPLRRTPAAGRGGAALQRFDGRDANVRRARSGRFERLDGRSENVRRAGSAPAARGRITPALRSRGSSLEHRNVWGEGQPRRGSSVGRSNAVRQGGVRLNTVRPSTAVRPNRSGWTNATRNAAPRWAAPRSRAPSAVAPAVRAPRRAAPEPARASGSEGRSKARGSTRGSTPRPSHRARPRSERGSSR